MKKCNCNGTLTGSDAGADVTNEVLARVAGQPADDGDVVRDATPPSPPAAATFLPHAVHHQAAFELGSHGAHQLAAAHRRRNERVDVHHHERERVATIIRRRHTLKTHPLAAEAAVGAAQGLTVIA